MSALLINIAYKYIQKALRPVFFTGAGMSAESGVPTFRDAQTGLWECFPAEQLATESAFRANPARVWGWYEWRRHLVQNTSPHAGHSAIASYAARYPDTTLITQNVDDLHERAGHQQTIHLHGSLFALRCIDCGHPATLAVNPAQSAEGYMDPPLCTVCHGMIRPGVVWFGEALPDIAWQQACRAIEQCDLFICIGTSGIVQPAASLPMMAAERQIATIQINPSVTPLDPYMQINLHLPAGETLFRLLSDTYPCANPI